MNEELYNLALLFYQMGKIKECKEIINLIVYLEIKEIIEVKL